MIATLASAQRGRMARWQLVAGGVSRSAIDRCVHSGRLLRVHPAVFALPGTEQVPLAPDAAAILAAGPGSRLGHHSGGVLWQLRIGVADPVHLTVTASRRGPAAGGGVITHRSTLFSDADTRIHRGLPVGAPAWILLELAATLPDREVERLLDEALFMRRIVTRRELEDMVGRAGGHPGRARLARVLGEPSPRRRTDSRPEERLLQLILAAGLPPPRTQAPVLGYELDLFWPGAKLAIEVDTYGTHGSSRRFAADRHRDARLLAEAGIVVLRFTDMEIDHRPLEVIATLARALAAVTGR
ncbi:MAG TPA: DUF559 domain-containing protein [Solirubrobacteraceae bacterium]|nr:DUF559 domain-containing protein [Solirubrobacteraceae bacterium]